MKMNTADFAQTRIVFNIINHGPFYLEINYFGSTFCLIAEQNVTKM
jgi:hypothetical protein